jgi:hypothetical protein
MNRRTFVVSIIGLTTIIGGCSETTDDSPGSENGNSDANIGENEVIDATAEEVIVTIEDFGSGWQRVESEDGMREFYNTEDELSISVEINSFDDIQSAEQAYERMKTEETDDGRIGFDEVNIGNNGMVVEPVSGLAIIIFRAGNFVAKIESFISETSFADPRNEGTGVAGMIVENIEDARSD